MNYWNRSWFDTTLNFDTLILNISLIKVNLHWSHVTEHFDGLAQDWSNSIANALELLQSSTKPLIYDTVMALIQY